MNVMIAVILAFSAYGSTVTLPAEDGVVDPDLYDEYIEARAGLDQPVVLMARDRDGDLVLARQLLPHLLRLPQKRERSPFPQTT